MGGTTQTKDTNSAFNQNSLQQFQSGSTGATSGTSSGATNRWAAAQPYLSGILAQLQGQLPATSITPTESSALTGLADSSGYIRQFLPGATSLATDLLAGGGADRSPIALDAYNQYLARLAPTAQGDYLDPAKNPWFNTVTGTIGTDVENRLKAMYAGSGRDPSGAGNYGYNLTRGISEGTAPVFANAYNAERERQLGAAGSLYGAGGTTAGLLSNLDQTRLANRQAGLGVAQTGQAFASDPFNTQLAAEAARRNIPLSTLQTLVQMGVPIAGLGSSYSGTTAGTQTGAQAGSTSGQKSGTETSATTTSTPFNPWSLAPLAFLPMTGGGSLGGSLLSGLGSGLFSSLSNGFMGPGAFTGR
jgi:hypothetical protein